MNRLVHLDLLRIVAIFLVVFNHTGNRGFTLFVEKIGSPLYFPYMLFSIVCKVAVPLFFMISGALLLSKQESYQKLFFKRILRILIVLILISVPYYFWLHRTEGLGISNFFTYVYGNSASTSLWYLYSYIGLLLLLPFLRSMVKNLQSKDYVYLILGHIALVGVLPCLEFCLWKGNVTIHTSFSATIFVTQNIFYAVVGYYLEHVFDETNYNRKTVLTGILLGIGAIIVTGLITYYQTVTVVNISLEQVEQFFECFICIPAIIIYLTVKYWCSRIHYQRFRVALAVLGEAVFGVYLIEKFARALTDCVYTILAPIAGSFVASLVWCAATIILSFLVVIPLKHIPGIKKIVNTFI